MAKKKLDVPVSYRPFLDHVKAIDWSRLEALVEGAPEPISMPQRCLFAVRALNGEALTAREWNQFVGAPIVRATSKPLSLPPELREEMEHFFGKAIEDRSWVPAGESRETWEKMKLEPDGWSGLDALVSWIASTNVILVPLERSDPRKTGDYRMIARSIPEALIFVLWLFLDPARPLGSTTLLRCHYSACRRYYLLNPKGPGRPPKKYCGKSCRDAGDVEEAKIRMRRKRK